MWDLEGNSLYSPLRGHRKLVRSVALRPDAYCLASASEDGTLRIWDISASNSQDANILLQTACTRLRYHPVFQNPQTDIEKAAYKTCQEYVWGHETDKE
jgi:WD40 repeat protein